MIRISFIVLALCQIALTHAGDYDRREWKHWIDKDGDCQNTRSETLISSSLFLVKMDFDNCRVIDGIWHDPYTNLFFLKAAHLDIDHIVPLKEAHLSGGESWSKEKKKEFANDPQNIIAVKNSANRSKGFKDPAQWMPPNKDYHCEYVRRWVLVKRKYQLDMDGAEMSSIIDALIMCKISRVGVLRGTNKPL
jgi:hypothetical protein